MRRYENAMIPGCTAAWQEVGTISCSLEPSPLLIVPFFGLRKLFLEQEALKFMGRGESFLSLDFKSLL